MATLGKLRPPYGGCEKCAVADCQRTLNEDEGAFLYRDLETDKLVVLCGSCGAWVELNRPERFLLVAL